MKTSTLLILLIVLLSGCHGTESSDNGKCEETAKKLDKLQRILAIPDFNHGVHDVSYSEVTSAISRFCDFKNDHAKDVAIGTYIPIANITDEYKDDDDPTTSGLFFVYCYDSAGTQDIADDKMFISYKYVRDFSYDTAYLLSNLQNVQFKRSNNNLKYSPASHDTASVNLYLKTQFTLGGSLGDVSFDSVINYNKQFKNHFQDNDDLNPNTVMLCDSEAYGFINKAELNKFFNQHGVDLTFDGIHFYWGYDHSLNQNRIRTYMVPCTNIKNVLYAKQQRGDGTYYYARTIFFERAWP